MAEFNNVSDRVFINKQFTMPTLLDMLGDGIIFSDCEGAERDIFHQNDKSWELLINKYDLLI